MLTLERRAELRRKWSDPGAAEIVRLFGFEEGEPVIPALLDALDAADELVAHLRRERQTLIDAVEAERKNRFDSAEEWRKALDAAEAELTRLRKTALVWHRYPEEKPPQSGRYLILAAFGHERGRYCAVRTWSEQGSDWPYPEVVAWAEMPKAEDVLGEAKAP